MQSWTAAPFNGTAGATTWSGTVTDPALNGGTSATFSFASPLVSVDVTDPQNPVFTGAAASVFGFESSGFGVSETTLGRFNRGESFTVTATHRFQLSSIEWREYTGDEVLNIQYTDGGVTYSEVVNITANPTAFADIFADANTPVRITNVSASTANLTGRLRFYRITIALVAPPIQGAPEAPHMFGVNLAGAEFGGSGGTYGYDYIYPNANEMNYYNAKGQNLIRLPFKWERLQPTMNAALNSAELGRIQTVVNLAAARGMKVILDMHNYDRRSVSGTSYLIGSAQVPNSAFADVWIRLATVFEGNSAIYGYGIMNEPHGTGGTWPVTAQACVDGIRTVDQTTFIIVAGDAWSAARSWPTSNPNLDIQDPSDRIIYEAHCYFDGNNDGTYGTYDAEAMYADKGWQLVKPFVDWLKAKNARGFIGEYGVPGDDPRWNVVLDRFLAYLNENGVSGTYWAGGPWWGSYPLSCEPTSNFTVDKPQMAVLQNYSIGQGGTGTGTGAQAFYYPNVDFTGGHFSAVSSTINHNWGTGAPSGSGYDPETWSGRWVAKLKPETSGQYTFYANIDDGARLWVNNQLVIDSWAAGGLREVSGSVFLRSGLKYNLRLEYFDNTGSARAELRWQGPGIPKEVIPQSALYPEGDGVRGLYYDNSNFTGTLVQRYDSRVFFSWGSGAPVAGIAADSFSVRWEGLVKAPGTGTYTIFANADDGIRVWVNGTQIINRWVNGAEVSGTISLNAGQFYTITTDYFDGSSNARAELRWTGPGLEIAKAVINEGDLFSSHNGVSTGTNLVP
jgi:endoglucanase